MYIIFKFDQIQIHFFLESNFYFHPKKIRGKQKGQDITNIEVIPTIDSSNRVPLVELGMFYVEPIAHDSL